MSLFADFLNEIKRNDSRGRCLHYESDEQCSKFINAHSIQKSNQLGVIAESGHIYRVTADLSTMRKNNGRPAPKKVGVKKASTFSGFCKRHDNDLFQPIDDFPLQPNAEQIALYAYRCICREFFVKQNAESSIESLKNHPELSAEGRSVLLSSLAGHSLGFHRLKHHKQYYDRALSDKKFDEFEYITFESRSPWNLQLSGVLYPDYDFEGRKLQDLGDHSSPLGFISFFTAPTSQGWSFSICWHGSSNEPCFNFVESLRSAVSNGEKLEDVLFRFSISCCENHAFRISWWDSLTDSDKTEILSRVELVTDLNIPIPDSYLAKGLEGIADWEFEHVYTSLSVGT
ncbi:MAG: hypothetical protein OIF55_13065 [Amphritea sp.]|nr:hypothetical protein [Amphritea sp.]